MILYGVDWSTMPFFAGQRISRLDVELYLFRKGYGPERGFPGKAENFWNIVAILWGPESRKHVIRNPWSEKIIQEMCRWKYLGITGPASSTKSDMGALWALVNYLSNPLETLCLVTSTSLKESKLRIWGVVEDYFNAVPGFPGKLTSSMGAIRFYDPATKKYIERSGIRLLASDQSNENDAVATIIGIKRAHGALIVIGDEMPEFSPAILNAAQSNLSSQPGFQFIGLGNANSPYDAFGQLITPKGGWKSIAADPSEYETELGYCIRFDAEKSPNVLAKKILFPFLPKASWIDEQKQKYGENSLPYWRMVRGWFCPDGSTEGVYSESEITSSGSEEKRVKWMTPPLPVCGQDPAFSNGGDETILQFGLFGIADSGVLTLHYTDRVSLKADAGLTVPHSHQIAKQTMLACQKREVSPTNFGYDKTGAGAQYGEILGEMWSRDIYGVTFAGVATNLLVGNIGAVPACDAYVDRVSEIWYSGKDFMRSGQLKGVDADMARDFISRRGDTVKAGGKIKMQVESKRKTRSRTGRSPDKGEAALILLDMLRIRHKFRAQVAVVVHHERNRKFREMTHHAEAMERTALLRLDDGTESVPEVPAIASMMPRKAIVKGGHGWSAQPLL